MAEEALVVDSSIVAKWFIIEEDSDAALKVRDRFATGKIELSVPSLLFYEVMNMLRYSGVFGEEELVTASRSLSKYDFEVWQPRGKLLEESVKLSLKGDVTVYDAFYLTLAARKRKRLITEDNELLEKFPDITISLRDFDSKVKRVG